MHVGIANPRWRAVPGIPGACATRNFTYLVRGPCNNLQSFFFYISLAHPFTRANNVTCYYGHKYVAVLNYAVCKNIIISGANFKIDINLSIINLKLNIVTFTAHIVFSAFFVYNALLQILLSCIYLLILKKKIIFTGEVMHILSPIRWHSASVQSTHIRY